MECKTQTVLNGLIIAEHRRAIDKYGTAYFTLNQAFYGTGISIDKLREGDVLGVIIHLPLPAEGEGSGKNCFKVYVKDRKTSEAVQKAAYKIGYSWANGQTQDAWFIDDEDFCENFLYFKDGHITWSRDWYGFLKSKSTEFTPEEFISLCESGDRMLGLKRED